MKIIKSQYLLCLGTQWELHDSCKKILYAQAIYKNHIIIYNSQCVCMRDPNIVTLLMSKC